MSNSTNRASVSRRGFIRVGALGSGVALAVACAPAAAPAAPAAAPRSPAGGAEPAWQQQWDDLVKAATKEGELVYDVTRSTSGMGKGVIPAFQEAFPGIKVTQTTSDSAAPFAEKVLQEQTAGVFSWDLLLISNAPFISLMPRGALTPIKPHLFHPDALDDKAWNGGFDAGWSDEAKQWGYGFSSDFGQALWVDTNQVNVNEMKTIQDFLNPKWKGKIAMADPRINGFGYAALTVARRALGNDILKRVLIDQAPAFSRDTRQITEWVVRGQYALGIGVVNTVLADMVKEGVGKNVKFVRIPEFTWLSASKPVWMPKQVPHPNAAKLFLNWLLTKPGQAAFNKSTPFNSRRVDVPPSTLETYPNPKEPKGFSIDSEAGSKYTDETVALCKEILK